MGRAQSEQLSQSALGQTVDPFNAQSAAQLQSSFSQASRTARRERTLAGIDKEQYDPFDTLKAQFGDEEASMASEQRGKRERARFSGTAGAARSALSKSKNL